MAVHALADRWNAQAKESTRLAAFHVYVPDVDAAFARAIAAGAESIGDPRDHEYGERAGYVRDAYGNSWYIATHAGPTPVPPCFIVRHAVLRIGIVVRTRGPVVRRSGCQRGGSAGQPVVHRTSGVIATSARRR
jgi:hypothetical protein